VTEPVVVPTGCPINPAEVMADALRELIYCEKTPAPAMWQRARDALQAYVDSQAEPSSFQEKRYVQQPAERGTFQERLTYTVAEAAALLGISSWCYYDRIKTGDLPALKIGNRFSVPKIALERLLEEGA
jgi:excisionase family DNA binding protein